VAALVRRHGATITLPSINKEQWHIAILRSGKGSDARAVWLDYDSGGAHGHADALNLGLFAYGLDLLPEFGYPPVQFGGWESPRAQWYKQTTAHNTVVVDGANQRAAGGKCTLWADGQNFHAVRGSCPEAAAIRRYERTVALCDVDAQSSYVVDVFRVAGGAEHVKFQHSHFGELEVDGVTLSPAANLIPDTQMRSFRMGRSPDGGFGARWTVQDRYGLLKAGQTVGLQHWELTENAEAGTCEGWIAVGGYNTNNGLWIPRLVVRSRAIKPATTFLAVLEPHNGRPRVESVRRLTLISPSGLGDNGASCAVEVRRADGLRDIVVAPDPERTSRCVNVPDANLTLDGDLCRVTLDAQGQVRRVAAVGFLELRMEG